MFEEASCSRLWLKPNSLLEKRCSTCLLFLDQQFKTEGWRKPGITSGPKQRIAVSYAAAEGVGTYHDLTAPVPDSEVFALAGL